MAVKLSPLLVAIVGAIGEISIDEALSGIRREWATILQETTEEATPDPARLTDSEQGKACGSATDPSTNASIDRLTRALEEARQEIAQVRADRDALKAALTALHQWVRDSDCCYGGSCIAMETENKLAAMLAPRL